MAKKTRKDLVKDVHEKLDILPISLTLNQIDSCISAFLECIKDELIIGNDIELRGFGTFLLKTRKAKENARNFKTGEKCLSLEHKIVSFKAGKEFKEHLREV